MSIKGGNVSNRPAVTIMNAITLIGPSLRSRCLHRRNKPAQLASHTPIAAVVTPDNAPDGAHIVKILAAAGAASLRSAKIPRNNEPKPAARIAAAAGPFRIKLGATGFTPIRVGASLILKQHDLGAPTHGCIFIQESTE